MSFARNLMHAHHATDYVQRTCRIRSDNQGPSVPAVKQAVQRARATTFTAVDQLDTALLARRAPVLNQKVQAEALLASLRAELQQVQSQIAAAKNAPAKALILRNQGLTRKIVEARRVIDELIREYAAPASQTGDTIRMRALAAIHYRGGNCQEQAAVAFEFLHRRGIRPLDLMHAAHPGDHEYIVIGRPSAAPVADPYAWGDEAVICDAWHGASYAADQFGKMMHPVGRYTPQLSFRLG